MTHDKDSQEFLSLLAAERRAYTLPLRASAVARDFVHDLLSLLFPHFAEEDRSEPEQVAYDYWRARERIALFLKAHPDNRESAADVAREFLGRLPRIRAALLADARATYDADPAARSVDEVIVAYPGFFALACHRFAHELYLMQVELLPRLMTEVAHKETGIDIHPGATIGRSMSIDHGTGIVIGETTVIGDRVRLYQGVTLGALSVDKHQTSAKRHPTIEDDVIIYANATILGGNTVIGAGSVIGGNVWLTQSVPPGSLVTEVAQIQKRTANGAGGAGGNN